MTDPLPDDLEDALADVLLRAPEGKDARLEALLEAHPEHAAALRGRAAALRQDSDPGPDPNAERIGPYVVLEMLGRGGMGAVYLARQHEPLQRDVAVKIIQGGSREILARFDLERQALAAMSHPSIAEVYDAGVTEAGQPYFVMEYVPGQPLTEYCDDRRLTVEERLAVFQQVCRGVQHAHRRGVLHRDLKPGNLLVAEGEGHPVVKIIDFGLARALDERLAGGAIHTLHGQLLGTPEYMSPEQASGDVRAVDTRSDVYSLGVVLYELLCGELPVASEELRAGSATDVQRRLQEATPPKPSTRVTSPSAAPEVPDARRASRASLSRRLRGDLDWVVMRAMEREPERRYESPAELALDLDRYLRGRPVLAGPPSAVYRLQKFVRRYRGRVTAAALLLLSLIGGLIGTSLGLGEARTQQARAEGALRSIHEISQWFIVDLHDQLGDVPGTLAARRELVVKGLTYLEELERQRGDDPTLVFDVARGYLRVGTIQGWPYASNVGDADGALASFATALELADRVDDLEPGGYPTDVLRIDVHLRSADVHTRKTELKEALAAIKRARAQISSLPTDERRWRWSFDAALKHAGVLMRNGDSDGAMAQFADAEARLRATSLADADDDTLDAVGSLNQQLGGIHSSEFLPGRLWDPERARACFARALEAHEELAARHPGSASSRRLVVTTRLGMASLLRRTGDPAAAIEAYREVATAIETSLAQDPASMMELDQLETAREGLARTLRDEGELDGAVDAFEQALDAYARRVALAPDDLRELQNQATTMEMLGGVHARRGDVDSLREIFAHALEVRRLVERSLPYAPDDYPSSVSTWLRLIEHLLRLDAPRAAVEERRALDAELRARRESSDDAALRACAWEQRVQLGATLTALAEAAPDNPEAGEWLTEAHELLLDVESETRGAAPDAPAGLAELIRKTEALLEQRAG